jgi:hypothetical protein
MDCDILLQAFAHYLKVFSLSPSFCVDCFGTARAHINGKNHKAAVRDDFALPGRAL